MKIALRSRVVIACTALGLTLGLVFAGSLAWINETYEHIMVDVILRDQADDFSARMQADPGVRLPHTPRLTGYLQPLNGRGDVPTEFLHLPPGVSENDDSDDNHVGVYDTTVGRMVFVIDLSGIEALEQYVVWWALAIVVIGTLGGAWLGRLLAGRIVFPVRRLAEAVDVLPTAPSPSRMTDLVADDELGRLARAIDAYRQRLSDADASERQFFADASHELRTPIAVMRGAAEVLLDEPEVDPAQQRRLRRLERGLVEVTDLLEAMLGVARRRRFVADDIDLSEWLGKAATNFAQSERGAGVRIAVEAQGHVALPRNEATLVLRGVLRKLVPTDAAGSLSVHGDESGIRLAFVPAAAEAPRGFGQGLEAGASDRGAHATLVGRFAESLGWRVAYAPGENGERRAAIGFRAEPRGE